MLYIHIIIHFSTSRTINTHSVFHIIYYTIWIGIFGRNLNGIELKFPKMPAFASAVCVV